MNQTEMNVISHKKRLEDIERDIEIIHERLLFLEEMTEREDEVSFVNLPQGMWRNIPEKT